jgi:acyl carrier protein
MLDYQQTYEKAQARRETNERIKSLIVNTLELNCSPEQITDDQPLFGRGLGLDSLDALELVVSIEEEFEVSVSDDDVSTLSTINKIADYIEAYQEGRTLAPSPTFSQLMLS